MDSVADVTPPPETCRNCGARTSGHYCSNCGQETRVTLPTFAAFMRDAAGRYIALDGRLWRTLATLVARPGMLTREYLNGRRRRYIRPARLFLVLYLLLFAAIGLLKSPTDLGNDVAVVDSDKAKAETAKAGEDLRKARNPSGAARGKDGKADGPALAIVEADEDDTLFGLDKDLNLTLKWDGKELDLPPQLQRRWDHFKKLPREEKAEQIYAGMLRFGPYAMAALLPAFALLLKLAYLGRGKRYPGRPQRYAEHLVYSAHLHAFAAIMILAFLLAPFAAARVAIAAWIAFYAVRARQVVYRGRWWAGLLRAVVIAICYLVLLSLAMLGLLAVAVMLR
ncbi:MAG TPA: DUF3667 domain-containing protein [Casimicrobiaceae bacterium]|nr:DUF3667 domain-containing protein [Casimicrobiaceae bacterium]